MCPPHTYLNAENKCETAPVKDAKILVHPMLNDDDELHYKFSVSESAVVSGLSLEQFHIDFHSSSDRVDNYMVEPEEGSITEREVPATVFIKENSYNVKASVSDGDFFEQSALNFVPNPRHYFTFEEGAYSHEETIESMPGTDPLEFEITLNELFESCDGSLDFYSEFDTLDFEVRVDSFDGFYLVKQPVFDFETVDARRL